MRIQVTTEGRNFTIAIPTGLIFNRASAWLYIQFARKSVPHARQYMPERSRDEAIAWVSAMPEAGVYALCDELRRIKKKHGSWELVDVQTSDSTKVKIIL